jgi:hypothetical protein
VTRWPRIRWGPRFDVQVAGGIVGLIHAGDAGCEQALSLIGAERSFVGVAVGLDRRTATGCEGGQPSGRNSANECGQIASGAAARRLVRGLLPDGDSLYPKSRSITYRSCSVDVEDEPHTTDPGVRTHGRVLRVGKSNRRREPARTTRYAIGRARHQSELRRPTPDRSIPS